MIFVGELNRLDIRKEFDALYMAGSLLFGHPMGIRASVLAFHQAAEADKRKNKVKEYSKEHPELRVAVEKWGSS